MFFSSVSCQFSPICFSTCDRTAVDAGDVMCVCVCAHTPVISVQQVQCFWVWKTRVCEAGKEEKQFIKMLFKPFYKLVSASPLEICTDIVIWVFCDNKLNIFLLLVYYWYMMCVRLPIRKSLRNTNIKQVFRSFRYSVSTHRNTNMAFLHSTMSQSVHLV